MSVRMDTRKQESDRTAERRQMVENQLARRGIRDRRVLAAMRRVPREQFIPASLAADAYGDRALPVECEQTISQPYMVARMTEVLAVKPGAKVLEIGTGTGYQTAILAELGARAFTIERIAELTALARERLESLGYRDVVWLSADGSDGWPEHAPFDGILVTAGSPAVPPALPGQLAVGGRLVVPVGPANDQTLTRVVRTETGFPRDEIMACRFVKLIGTGGWPP